MLDPLWMTFVCNRRRSPDSRSCDGATLVGTMIHGGKGNAMALRVDDVEDSVCGTALLVGTRKGVFVVRADEQRQTWTTGDPMFLGHIAQQLPFLPV